MELFFFIGCFDNLLIDFNLVNFKGLIVKGSLVGNIKDTQSLVDYCIDNNIYSDIELVKYDAINNIYKNIVQCDVRYKYVMDIRTLKY